MGDTDTLHGTLPSSMTVEPEPTREHLAERLSVLERELAQAKRTILTLECERDEAKVPATFPGPQFELDTLRKDFEKVRAWYTDAMTDRDKTHANYCKARDERDKLKHNLELLRVERDSTVDARALDLACKEKVELKHELDICKAERDELKERFATLMTGRSIQTPERGPVRLYAQDGSGYWARLDLLPVTPKHDDAITQHAAEADDEPIPSVTLQEWKRSFLERTKTPPKTPKPRPDLIPAEALLEAGACMAGGLERDDPNGQPWYETAPRADALRKYHRSMLRHVLAWYAGEKVDGDSGKSPLAHIICNASILFWLERRK